MKPLRVAFTTIAALLLAFTSSPVFAQGQLDHLICYRMVDPLKVQSAVDLFAELQPEFSQQGCKLVRPLEFCVPATKRTVTPPPPFPEIVGQALKDDYICYLMKCPDKPVVPSRHVADQFGRRLQRKYRPVKVCVPARKAAPPCGPTTSARQCGGTCDDPAALCHYDKIAKICTCSPPQGCAGRPDAAGHCGGTCPVGEICLAQIVPGAPPMCDCQPPPPPPCGLNTASGTCGGTCPNANDKCVVTATGNDCICQPTEPGCVPGATAGQCSGACTFAPGFLCQFDTLTNQCRCQPPPQPCGPNPLTGQCGGLCTGALKCRFTPGTATPCTCQP
jgi:hypothetical protein